MINDTNNKSRGVCRRYDKLNATNQIKAFEYLNIQNTEIKFLQVTSHYCYGFKNLFCVHHVSLCSTQLNADR